MKISCFTFIRNAEILDYPFIASIKSALPICDEFVINVGESEDSTLEMIQALNEPKIRIIQSKWNEKVTKKGFVYAQQKCIAHYNCTGDWAFYIEADEVLHENDYDVIKQALEDNLHNDNVEALALKYVHFWGNHNTYLDNGNFYRQEVRIIKNNLRSFTSDSLFFLVLDQNNKRGRYPKAKIIDATMYHYGWARSQQANYRKFDYVGKYWNNQRPTLDSTYANVDKTFLKEFKGTHPGYIQDWLPKGVEGLYLPNPDYVITKTDKRRRNKLLLEKIFRKDFTRKHFTTVK